MQVFEYVIKHFHPLDIQVKSETDDYWIDA